MKKVLFIIVSIIMMVVTNLSAQNWGANPNIPYQGVKPGSGAAANAVGDLYLAADGIENVFRLRNVPSMGYVYGILASAKADIESSGARFSAAIRSGNTVEQDALSTQLVLQQVYFLQVKYIFEHFSVSKEENILYWKNKKNEIQRRDDISSYRKEHLLYKIEVALQDALAMPEDPKNTDILHWNPWQWDSKKTVVGGVYYPKNIIEAADIICQRR